MAIFILKMYLFYLKELQKERRRETERKIFHLLAHSTNSYSIMNWEGPRLRVREELEWVVGS